MEGIKKSLEQIYDVRLTFFSMNVPIDKLYPTEDFLENDKVALVLKKIIAEGYDVPIVSVEKEGDYFVLDGHHRAYLYKKLMHQTIQSFVLEFPRNTSYREIPKRTLDSLPIVEVASIDDLILRAWQKILSILKHYEAIYNVPFYMRTEQVRLTDLVPTQFQVREAQVDAIKKLLVPIVCVRYVGRYYILDGHARAVRAEQLNQRLMQTVILFPENPIDYGIVKTAKETGLKSVEDIKIVKCK
jgi:hypothetical protein